MIMMMSEEKSNFFWCPEPAQVVLRTFTSTFVPYDGEGKGDGEGDKSAPEGDDAPATLGQVRSIITDSLKSVVADLKIVELTEQVTSLAKKVEAKGKGTPKDNNDKGTGDKGTGSDKGMTLPPEVTEQLIEMKEKISSLEGQLTETQKAKEEADKKLAEESLNSDIRGVLEQHEFITEKAKNTAFALVRPYIRKSEDGKLIAGDKHTPRPAKSFVKDFFEKDHPYLLKDGNAGGAGVGAGGAGGTGISVTTEDIAPGMSKEKRLAAVTSIHRALAG